MLALSFLLMIGMTLIADGFGFHIERGYIYAAMFFSSLVELSTALPGATEADEMTFESLVLFAAVYFAAVATPGPGIAALVARVLAQGLKGVAPFIAGYFVGDMIWLTFAGTGLAVVAKTFAGVFVAIKFAGAAYLLYLAWRMATAPGSCRSGAAPATRGWRAFFGSLSLTLGNPKVMVFFLSIMPLVVDLKAMTAFALVEVAARLRDRDLLDARRSTHSPPTGRGLCSARPGRCDSSIAPPAA